MLVLKKQNYFIEIKCNSQEQIILKNQNILK